MEDPGSTRSPQRRRSWLSSFCFGGDHGGSDSVAIGWPQKLVGDQSRGHRRTSKLYQACCHTTDATYVLGGQAEPYLRNVWWPNDTGITPQRVAPQRLDYPGRADSTGGRELLCHTTAGTDFLGLDQRNSHESWPGKAGLGRIAVKRSCRSLAADAATRPLRSQKRQKAAGPKPRTISLLPGAWTLNPGHPRELR